MILQTSDIIQLIADIVAAILNFLKPIVSPLGGWMVSWIETALKFFPQKDMLFYIILFVIIIIIGCIVNIAWPGDKEPAFKRKTKIPKEKIKKPEKERKKKIEDSKTKIDKEVKEEKKGEIEEQLEEIGEEPEEVKEEVEEKPEEIPGTDRRGRPGGGTRAQAHA